MQAFSLAQTSWWACLHAPSSVVNTATLTLPFAVGVCVGGGGGVPNPRDRELVRLNPVGACPRCEMYVAGFMSA